MAEVPLKLSGGFYQARSIIASAERCVNLYPERNQEGAPFPFTMYQTPGLAVLAEGAGEPGRGLYEASNGKLFLVEGQQIFYVDQNWGRTSIGTLEADRSTPVSMQDNGFDLVVVDGSTSAKTIDLATLVVSDYSDPNFLGADFVGYLDTFLVFNQPETRNFYCTLSNSLTIDPLDIAGKVGYPDLLVALAVMHLDIWLFGAKRSTEVWVNAGGSFPFVRQPGIFIEHGCVAKYSVAKHDLILFFLGIDDEGLATVFMGVNYAVKKISTPAIAARFAKYAVVSDAIGWTYKQADHIFYVLSFPTQDVTWVYDVSEDLWHERTWTDGDGVEHRVRGAKGLLAYGTNVCVDWENGTLYKMDLETFTDAELPIVRRRSFPQVVANGQLVEHRAFTVDMQTGQETMEEPAEVSLRWSDDRGRTFGNPLLQGIGNTGDYGLQATWNQLGVSRWRVYEMFWSANVDTALNGAWLDFGVAESGAE